MTPRPGLCGECFVDKWYQQMQCEEMARPYPGVIVLDTPAEDVPQFIPDDSPIYNPEPRRSARLAGKRISYQE